MRGAWGLALGLLALAAAGIVVALYGVPTRTPEPAADRLVLREIGFDALPGWRVDAVEATRPALDRSCRVFAARPPDRPVGPDGVGGMAADWHEPCAALEALPQGDAAAVRAWLETWFRPFRAFAGTEPVGLFTGYYEPELNGARAPDERFNVPLHQRPDDLVTVDLGRFADDLKGKRIAGRVDGGQLLPYPDRTAIVEGALAGRDLELVWVDDPIAAFFLHIQGSGRVRLPDGSSVQVGYAAQNGRDYFAIGRELIARGVLTRENVSLQSIRAWLEANPDEAPAVMGRNPSYVFFRELTGEGPLGAMGIALTPERSLAIDPRHMPLGAPVWIDVEDPLDPKLRLRRLVVAQDTGGAIRGPIRGDLFWGAGDEAEHRAGMMKSKGEYYLLLPRTVAARAAARAAN